MSTSACMTFESAQSVTAARDRLASAQSAVETMLERGQTLTGHSLPPLEPLYRLDRDLLSAKALRAVAKMESKGVVVPGDCRFVATTLPLGFRKGTAVELKAATVPALIPPHESDEYLVCQIAHAVATQISAMPVWSSDYLATHRQLLDLDDELDEIYRHARKVADLRAQIAAPTDVNDPVARTRMLRDSAADTAIIDQVAGTVRQRVAALFRYGCELFVANEEWLVMQATQKRLSLHADAEELLIQAAADDLAITKLSNLTDDAERLRLSLDAHLQILAGDLTALASTGEPAEHPGKQGQA